LIKERKDQVRRQESFFVDLTPNIVVLSYLNPIPILENQTKKRNYLLRKILSVY